MPLTEVERAKGERSAYALIGSRAAEYASGGLQIEHWTPAALGRELWRMNRDTPGASLSGYQAIARRALASEEQGRRMERESNLILDRSVLPETYQAIGRPETYLYRIAVHARTSAGIVETAVIEHHTDAPMSAAQLWQFALQQYDWSEYPRARKGDRIAQVIADADTRVQVISASRIR